MKIDKLVEIQLGHPFRGSIKEAAGLGTLVVQYKDVDRDSGVDWSTVIAAEVKGRAEPKWLQNGDILFAGKGNTIFSALVKDIPADKKAVASPHFFVIRTNNSRLILGEYLNWYLNQAPAQAFYHGATSGTVVKNLTKTRLLELDIPVPPLAEQHTIAKLHNVTLQHSQTLQQQIANNEQMMSQLAYDIKRRLAE